MKLSGLVTASLLLVIINAEEYCIPKLAREGSFCLDMELRLDKAITFNSTGLSISHSEGSIGMETFSLMHNLVELEITHSEIDQIEDGALCSLPKLELLTIERNKKFPGVSQSLLSNCGKIKSFLVTHVQLEPDALKSMENLQRLDMRYIDFPSFTKDYLEPLKNLKWLQLFKCKIEQIDGGALCLSPKLEFFVMNSNTAVPPLTKAIFENCKTLDDFRFRFHENITVEVEEEAFSGLSNIRTAQFDYLRINQLTKGHLSGLTGAEELSITLSNITKINVDAFRGFNRLKRLFLGSNYLTEIDSEILASLAQLTHLGLENNQLTTIDKLSHPRLQWLDVSSNAITKIDTNAIRSNFPNLKYVGIGGNGMSCEYEDLIKSELSGISVSGTPNKGELWL